MSEPKTLHVWTTVAGTECRIEEGADGFWRRPEGDWAQHLRRGDHELLDEILRLAAAEDRARLARVEGMREALAAVEAVRRECKQLRSMGAVQVARINTCDVISKDIERLIAAAERRLAETEGGPYDLDTR